MQKAIPRTRSGFTRVQALNRAGNKTFQIRTVLAQDKVYMTKHGLVVVPDLIPPPSLPSAQLKKAGKTQPEFIPPREPDETEEYELPDLIDGDQPEPLSGQTSPKSIPPVNVGSKSKGKPVRKSASK